LRDAPTLKRFLARHGYEPRRLSSRDLAEARALRDALRAAFTARDEDTAVRELNGVLAGSAAKPQFQRSGEEWGVRWVGRVSDSVATAAAMSLLEAIRDDGWDRFGICAGAPCCCVFVDRSKNRSRRFCSDLCADRVAQALHRERRRSNRPAGAVRGARLH
jgi:predicted RNA-binding Zn ribbon-like protein